MYILTDTLLIHLDCPPQTENKARDCFQLAGFPVQDNVDILYSTQTRSPSEEQLPADGMVSSQTNQSFLWMEPDLQLAWTERCTQGKPRLRC